MSSKNRGAKRSANDYYITPSPHIVTFLREFKRDWMNQSDPIIDWTRCPFTPNDKLLILDPSAGGDENNPMSYPEALKVSPLGTDSTIVTIDIREDSPAEIKHNFLTHEFAFSPDIVITNPPFELAIEFIKKSLSVVRKGGLVIMLLRLPYMESAKRFSFFDRGMPNVIYNDSRRIAFWPKNPSAAMMKWAAENDVELKPGASDSVPHAHFVWQEGVENKFAKIRCVYTDLEMDQTDLFLEKDIEDVLKA